MSSLPAQTLASSLPSAGVIAAGLAGALVVIAALTVLLVRRPDAFPLLAVFALPFRLPISAQDRTVNLLIPLYLVVAAGTLAYLCRRLRGTGTGTGTGAGEGNERRRRARRSAV